MAKRCTYEFADPVLDIGEDPFGRSVTRRPVPDHRARVAHEVGERNDATAAQDIGSCRRVGGVGGGSDNLDGARKRLREATADYPRPSSGDNDLGIHRREKPIRRPDRQAIVNHAPVAVNAAQRKQPLNLEP